MMIAIYCQRIAVVGLQPYDCTGASPKEMAIIQNINYLLTITSMLLSQPDFLQEVVAEPQLKLSLVVPHEVWQTKQQQTPNTNGKPC